MSDLRAELIQVAAVAVAIVTDLDQGDTMMQTHQIGRAIQDVVRERLVQEQKWGTQHHSIAEWLAILGEEYGEACRSALDERIFPKGGDHVTGGDDEDQ